MKKTPIVFVLAALAGALHGQMLEITSSGVGIGTATPESALHVNGSIPSTPSSTGVQLGTSGSYSGMQIYGAAGGFIDFSDHSADFDYRIIETGGRFDLSTAAANPAFSLTQNGHVGIGTTTPGKTFEVVGAIISRYSAGSGGLASSCETGSDGLQFWVNASYDPANPFSGWGRAMTIATSGNVGIGVTSPSYKLEVNGTVRATSFVSNSTTYADFVFKPGYRLPPLGDVEAAIRRDGHLPDIPGEAEVKAHGVDLASQQAKLLQKVEELTLYAIEQNKRIEALQGEVLRLKTPSSFQP